MSALALQESRERRETKLQVEIESGESGFDWRLDHKRGKWVPCLFTVVSTQFLLSVIECPVCYAIPRQLPIPCCPAGEGVGGWVGQSFEQLSYWFRSIY